MNKPLCFIMAPVPSRSGYGDRSRDIVRSLVELKGNEWDIKIAPTRWGACPQNALNEKDPNDVEIISRLHTGTHLRKQPDIFIQISVPSEFQKMGKYNIGITAGIETTACDASWTEGCNNMDLILVSSEHSKKVLKETQFDKINEQSKQKMGELRMETPIEVLFEGVNLDLYKKVKKFPKTLVDELQTVKEDFCFLFVGHWLQGDFGHDRKDIGGLIKTFCETFKGLRKKPALILKTSGAGFSVMDRDNILNKIKSITEQDKSYPNVYLLHGDLYPEEVNALYNHPKVKAHVSFTKGEGFGRPLAEAALSGKPVIAPNWSGHTDFLHPEYACLLAGQLLPVHKSAQWKGVINEGSAWHYVNYDYASKVLKDVYKNHKAHMDRVRKLPQHIRTNFSMEKMTEKFSSILETKVTVKKQVSLNLPTLKKAKPKTNLPKLNLPKLNR